MSSLSFRAIAYSLLWISTSCRPSVCTPLFANETSSTVSDITEAFASRTYFYAGGQYVNATLPGSNTTAQYMTGQIYVEQLIPGRLSRRDPVVFITGEGQTGTNWLNTPDGREGWASYFLRHGYEVYITDMAQRGRAAFLPGDGSQSLFSTTTIEQLFTAPQTLRPLPYPQAYLHRQWPGSGLVGDAIFDAFYASQVPTQANTTKLAEYNRASYSALLDRLGRPAIVITHSQSGPFGWQLGDARPHLVRGIVALEPQGPPFTNWAGPPFRPGYSAPGSSRQFGVTALPLHYAPPVGDDASLLQTQTIAAVSTNVSACTLQTEPARKLVNLAGIPVLLITSEASYHAVYDYCTVKYLQQAGVSVKHVQLGNVGIRGNGHFSFMEKNNDEIAEKVVLPWMEKLEGMNAQ